MATASRSLAGQRKRAEAHCSSVCLTARLGDGVAQVEATDLATLTVYNLYLDCPADGLYKRSPKKSPKAKKSKAKQKSKSVSSAEGEEGVGLKSLQGAKAKSESKGNTEEEACAPLEVSSGCDICR